MLQEVKLIDVDSNMSQCCQLMFEPSVEDLTSRLFEQAVGKVRFLEAQDVWDSGDPKWISGIQSFRPVINQHICNIHLLAITFQ